MSINTSLYKPNQQEGLPHPYLDHFYQTRLFYLQVQLDYLIASNGNGLWEMQQVEAKITNTKQKLKELHDHV
ncbi:hypothetical protein [Halomonas litopenaei]|uniref:hypothetical protein n=1 Tax=Halomonas litopenaei TaxID=2109328 RepID=UPI001A8C3397|nr:hypothetical protein [Halomonas litopenaei]MBN8414356.1 hypothetical protein [Halomonas litopenaei]